MLKYSSLILLLAVAACWSSVDANRYQWYHPHALAKRSVPSASGHRTISSNHALSYNKRETVDSSEELNEDMVKELIVGFLLLTVDSSSEKDVLEDKFKEALEKKWDSLDDFGNHISKVYEEVTGIKLSESAEDE